MKPLIVSTSMQQKITKLIYFFLNDTPNVLQFKNDPDVFFRFSSIVLFEMTTSVLTSGFYPPKACRSHIQHMTKTR